MEKVLENFRDIAAEMGPAAVTDYMEPILGVIEKLLDKKAVCQQKDAFAMEDGQDDDNSCEEDEEDLDHDEVILGNTTDLINELSKCLKDGFVDYLRRLGPKLV